MASILSCLSWIPSVCEEFFHGLIPKTRPIPALPDDIIFNILTRLPVKQVVECQTVCKTWMNLTRTRYFMESHLNQAKPRIMIQHIRYSEDFEKELEVCLIRDWRRVRSVENIIESTVGKKILYDYSISSRFGPYILGFSYNGLLVLMPDALSDSPTFLICNPITGEKITIPVAVRNERLCGIFLHPKTKDYMALFWYGSYGSPSYKICSLSPGSPWKRLGKDDILHSCSPPDRIPPVVLNEALHWVSNSRCSSFIKVYRILSEQLTAMPHPEDSSFPCEGRYHDHDRMRILEIQGHLALSSFPVEHNDTLMVVRVLEDYENWEWIKKYVIKLEIHGGFRWYEAKMVIPLGVLEGEMVIHWINKGLFGYQLEEGKLRRYHQWRGIQPLQGTWRVHGTYYLSLYTPSLVPLTNQSEEP